MALVFSTPVKILPQANLVQQARWGNQDTLDRGRYLLHKDEWNPGVPQNTSALFQSRESGESTWSTEETIASLTQTLRPEAKMAVDLSGRRMIVYRNRSTNDIVGVFYTPWSGIWTSQIIENSPFRLTDPIGLEARATGGFVCVYLSTGGGEAEEDEHPHLFEWDPISESWGVFIELPALVPDPGSVTARGCSLGINRIDGIYHLAAPFSTGITHYKTWHMTHDPATRISTAWTLVSDVGFPTHHYDPLIIGSKTQAGTAHLILTRDVANDGTNSRILYFKYSGGVWSTQEQVSQAALVSGCQANFDVDLNDDLYVVYTEYNGVDMAIMAKRRIVETGVWETAVEVATSTLSTTNGWDGFNQDPFWPGIIRAPFNKFMDKFIVTWGSDRSAFTPELWISEAVIRAKTEEDFVPGTGGAVNNEEVRVFDGIVGGAWSRWKGKDA